MLHGFLGSFLDEGSFHLSKTRQQSNDQGCEFPQPSGIDQAIESPDIDPLNLEVVEAVDHLNLRPTQAVQLRHDQLITLSERIKAGFELVALLQWCP
jgi:hypothetical protein